MCLLSLGGLDWTGHIIHVKYICGLFTRVAAQVNTRIYERVRVEAFYLYTLQAELRPVATDALLRGDMSPASAARWPVAKNPYVCGAQAVLRLKGARNMRVSTCAKHSPGISMAAQDLLIRGYDLAAIMRAGGWSDPSTVSRYLRFSQHNIWQQ